VKYPFKKLDVVAVPDFSAGAMENTAAIFYRETLLLADPTAASTDVRKEIAAALAHDMAHQWSVIPGRPLKCSSFLPSTKCRKPRTLKQAVERMTTCADLATAQSPKLTEWLKR
jgi:Peptidase family M1 domain